MPDPNRLAIDRRTHKLIVEGIPFILNPVDVQALELALRLRDRGDARIVVLSVDHTGAESELREALALGADEAILLSDPAVEGSDPAAQAHLFQAILARFVKPKVILAASRSIDHTWSTVGPQLARLLDWPLIVEAENLELEGDRVRSVAHTGGRRALVEASAPAVVTVARDAIRPRHATSWGVADAFEDRRLRVLGLRDLDVDEKTRAMFRPRTQVKRVRLTPLKRGRRVIEGAPDEVARVLAQRLISQGWGGRRP